MFNTELGIFCNLHNNWAELLVEEPYFLKIKEDGPYVIFNYDQIRSDFSNPIVQEARGIIFRKGSWENPVCWAFNKFGNYGEGWVKDIDWSTAFVSEKVDGSLIKVWWDGSWKISTNGTIDAWKAEIGDARMPNFGTYFEYTLRRLYQPRIYRKAFEDFTIDLDENLTYMFELVGPYNRVVIPYEEPAIYFLGARNKYTGEEFNCSSLVAGVLNMGRFKLPKQYPLNSLEHCIKITKNFPWDAEGVVACDAQFNRVKIKSPAYVLAHYTRNNNVITRRHLIKVILQNEVEEFKCYASDYVEELTKIQKLMNAFYVIGDQLAVMCQALSNIPKSTYARLVKTCPKIFQGLMFSNYDKVVTVKTYTANWTVYKWEELLDALEKFLTRYNFKEDLYGL